MQNQFFFFLGFSIALYVGITKAGPATDGSDWCDDDALKNISHQVELLKVLDENMSLKLDLLKSHMDQKLASQKITLFEDLRELLSAKEGLLIDVRTGASSSAKETIVGSSLQPSSCAEAMKPGDKSGIYKLYLTEFGLKPFFAYCLEDPNNGPAWTIVQRRQDGSIDFYRVWDEYKFGFGNLNNEFFIGLDKLHALTNHKVQELWIKLVDFEDTVRFAKYDSFAIGSEQTKYDLNLLGAFRGDAGDSLINHQGCKFTTKDQHNDKRATNCALDFTGAWWYLACHDSNLNGQYLKGAYAKEKFGKGIDWRTWRGHNYSMKYVHMAIRPAQNK